MEKPNRTAADSELAEARERIQALTGLLDAIGALADQPLPAKHGDPVATVASQRANDRVALYASGTAGMSTEWLRNRTGTVAKNVAEPLPYAAEDHEAFGAVRAAYLARTIEPESPAAQPETAPAAEPEAGP